MGDAPPDPVWPPAREFNFEEPFLALLNTHRGLIHRIARTYATQSVDREDLFQKRDYQLGRYSPSSRGESSPITWLYRVALNPALTAVRKRARRPRLVPLEAGPE